MNYAVHIAPDPVEESHHAVDDMSSSLDSFFSEATIEQTPINSDDLRHPLWEFPEEGAASSAHTTVTLRRWTMAAPYVSLVLVAVIAAITGLWWAEVIPGSRRVATAETAPPAAIAPVTSASRDTSNVLSTELSSSMQVWPSARPPIAAIVPSALPLSAATEQTRTPDQAAAALANRSAPAMPIATAGTRQVSEPLATLPSTANLPAPSPSPILEMPTASALPPAVAPLPSSMPANVVRPEPAAVASVVAATEQSEIQRTLAQYRTAYQLLDAQAAQAVWPTVDVRALARAFDSLASQQLAFENCELQIAGELATAECRGSATYAPKVGNRGPRLEPRQWTFRLQKEREGWKIQSAQTRR